MKTLTKTLLVALVVILMTAATFLSASAAAPSVPSKGQVKAQVISNEFSSVSAFTFHNNSRRVENSNNDVKLDTNDSKSNDFTMTMPWAVPNPTGWTNPNARANSFC